MINEDIFYPDIEPSVFMLIKGGFCMFGSQARISALILAARKEKNQCRAEHCSVLK